MPAASFRLRNARTPLPAKRSSAERLPIPAAGERLAARRIAALGLLRGQLGHRQASRRRPSFPRSRAQAGQLEPLPLVSPTGSAGRRSTGASTPPRSRRLRDTRRISSRSSANRRADPRPSQPRVLPTCPSTECRANARAIDPTRCRVHELWRERMPPIQRHLLPLPRTSPPRSLSRAGRSAVPQAQGPRALLQQPWGPKSAAAMHNARAHASCLPLGTRCPMP